MSCDFIVNVFGDEWAACSADSDAEWFHQNGEEFSVTIWAVDGQGSVGVSSLQTFTLAADFNSSALCQQTGCSVEVEVDQPSPPGIVGNVTSAAARVLGGGGGGGVLALLAALLVSVVALL